jgi:hypothetical protein
MCYQLQVRDQPRVAQLVHLNMFIFSKNKIANQTWYKHVLLYADKKGREVMKSQEQL